MESISSAEPVGQSSAGANGIPQAHGPAAEIQSSQQRSESKKEDGHVYRPELIIGLIGPVGCGLATVVQEAERQLARFDYITRVIKVSAEFREIKADPWQSLPAQGPREERYRRYMDAGDELRRRLKRNDAAMIPTLSRLGRIRAEITGKPIDEPEPAERVAFIIDSLKTPEELLLLRGIYGQRFIAISAYAPREFRRQTLTQEIAESHFENMSEKHLGEAAEIIDRDERGKQADPSGQNVSDAFALADLFVDSESPTSIETNLPRFFDLLFGSPFITPTRDEYCMFIAHASAVRSASLSRQVGAVVATGDGDILSVGANEVPRAGGGLYWEGDQPDGRDFVGGYDTSTKRRQILVGDILKFLLHMKWIPPDTPPATGQETKAEADAREHGIVQRELQRLTPDRFYRDLLVHDILEFYREVHAEMAALLTAARKGITTEGCVLYTTTFPCHDCARHLVAAGIQKVVFIEPYPKSLVGQLFDDSISLDTSHPAPGHVPFQTFVGVGPTRYMQLFKMALRKDSEGRAIQWHEHLLDANVQPISYWGGDRRLRTAFQQSEYISAFRREDVVMSDFAEPYRKLQEGR